MNCQGEACALTVSAVLVGLGTASRGGFFCSEGPFTLPRVACDDHLELEKFAVQLSFPRYLRSGVSD